VPGNDDVDDYVSNHNDHSHHNDHPHHNDHNHNSDNYHHGFAGMDKRGRRPVR
jgi:hypothetical protein